MNPRTIAARYGTPCFVYDLDEAAAACAGLLDALPTGSVLHYSLKANPHPAVAEVFARAGLRAEVSSTGELVAALAAGFAPASITYSGPAKTAGELDVAFRTGVRRFSVESHRDLLTVDAAASRAGTRADCLLRINADRPAGGTGLAMTGVSSKFGVDLQTVLKDPSPFLQTRSACICGLHLYMGTNLADEDALLDQFAIALDMCGELAAALDRTFDELDLGGGFGAPYAAPGPRPSFPTLRPRLEALLDQRAAGWRGGSPIVSFESGRHLVASCGTLLTTVVDVKESKGQRYVLLDSGVHHLGGLSGLRRLPAVQPEPVPLTGPAAEAAEVYEASAASDASDARTVLDGEVFDGETHLAGPLCTPADQWGRRRDLPRLRPGDLVAVPNTGAYGLTASLLGFLSYPIPVEVVVSGGQPAAASRLTLTRTPVKERI
ncbi:MAG: type III PLP-dependent enzyme [Catenulispora sp.]|nr:type III PLP-dependent enzyme [Catenulispora sp.]